MTTEAEIGAMLPEAKDCRQHQSSEEARKHPPLESSEGTWPCDSSISNFQPLELREERFRLFSAAQIVELSCGSPEPLMQHGTT